MKLICLTDPHLVRPGEWLFDLDPRQHLDACLADINAHHADAHLCVITGDLVERGDVEAYENLRDCLSRLTVPVRLVLGNHDKPANFLRVFPEAEVDANGFVQSALATPAGRLLFLDTREPGAVGGRYCEARLAWLRDQLAAAAGAPVYLFMHHPPVRLGLEMFDRISLRDSDALADVLAAHGDVRHIFCGHVHRPVSGGWRGVPFTALPGTNHQFRLDFTSRSRIEGTDEPPAYAIVLLSDEATVVHIHDFLFAGRRFPL